MRVGVPLTGGERAGLLYPIRSGNFAKSLIDAGVIIKQVAVLLGHASLETTRIYTTPTEQDLVKAVEKLES